jgi:hypothetical protein
MNQTLYVVNESYDGYDAYEISYHLTRKGALRFIMRQNYKTWELCRYINEDSWDMPHMWISEGVLRE